MLSVVFSEVLMPDMTHPGSPSHTEAPGTSEPTSIPSTATPPPAPADGQSDWGDIPEEVLEDWCWIMNGRDEGVFDEYPGKHVAVYQQKIWGSSYDPDLLREYLALKHQIDPTRFVVVYIDRL
jgi:hypothetical protein